MKRPFLRSRDPSITPDVLQRWIELMVETAEGQRDLSEEELSQALVRQGVPPLTAVRLVVTRPCRLWRLPTVGDGSWRHSFHWPCQQERKGQQGDPPHQFRGVPGGG